MARESTATPASAMSPRPRRRSRVDGVLLPVALVLLALLLPGTTASPTKLVESLIDSNPKDLRDNRLQSEGGHPQHGLDDELLLVHVVFRHGDRTPDSPTYPNDPYGNFSYSPVGWGNLTPAGKRTEYRFGKFLRRRYDDFLGDYANGLVAVRSTDWARTKDSMALVLAGLFPPSKQQSWAGGVADDDNLLGSMWSPIAAESVPRREDKLLYVLDVPCPAYDKAFKEALQSPAFQKKFRGGQNAELISYLEKHSGAKINTPEDVYNIYQALLAQQGFGLTLPSWTTEVYPDKIKSLTSMYFDLDTYTRKMQRLRAGPLLKQSLQWSLARSKHSLQPANRKMYLYSAHDNNVAALLKALQVWESSVPPYGVAVIMEVKSRAGQIGVQLYLRNSTLPEVHPLTMPNCDNFCPLHKFVDLTSDVVPEDWDAECQEDTTVRSVETASAVTSTGLPDL